MADDREMSSTLAPLDVLLVRHAEPIPFGSEGTADDDRPLSEAGRAAAAELAAELDEYQVTAVYSSPYARSLETVRAIAHRRGLEIQLLADLRERRLSPQPMPDWRAALEQAWTDADFARRVARPAAPRSGGRSACLTCSAPAIPTAAAWSSAATATSSA